MRSWYKLSSQLSILLLLFVLVGCAETSDPIVESDNVILVNNIEIEIIDENNNPKVNFSTPIDNDIRDGETEILNYLGPTDSEGKIHYSEMESRVYNLLHYDISFEVTPASENQKITIMIDEPIID